LSLGAKKLSPAETDFNEAITPKKVEIESKVSCDKDSFLGNHVVVPSMTSIANPETLLPVTSVHTRYQIANDMTGGRIDALPSAI